MHGKFLLIGTGAFALGVLIRTLVVIPSSLLGVGIFVMLLALALCVFERHAGFLVVLVFVPCMLTGILRTSFAPMALPDAYQQYLNHKVAFTGTIVSDPSIREKNQQIVVRIDEKNEVTNVLVFAPLKDHFEYGENVSFFGTLTKPEPFSTDGGRVFRYDQYLAKRQIFSIVQYGSVRINSPPSGFISWVADVLFSIKHSFVAGLARAVPNPYGALATGLLTGDQHSLDDDVENTLIFSGLIWVVVLSGYHVTVIAEGVLWMCRWMSKRFSYAFAASAIIAIIFATGGSAPSLRGGAMALLMLYAQATDRTYDSIRALCVSMIVILLWNPLLLAYDNGFQLSLVVTPALILCTPILEARMLWITNTSLRSILAVSIIAQLAVLPLLLWQTGNLGVWSIPANIFVMPVVPLAMGCAVVAGFTGMITAPLAPLFGVPAHAVLFYILSVAQISAKLPYATTILPGFPFIFVIAAYAFLILAMRWLHNHPPKETIVQRQMPHVRIKQPR